MSIKKINVGAVQNDGTGDPLRDAFVKVNENFVELDSSVGSVSAANAAALRDRATHTGQQAIGTVAGLQSALDAKVDKVAGKGLSTEDYTTSEKNKLAGVAAGAQVNTVTSVAGKTGAVTLAKGDVGLGNVDNTADSVKPVSTAQAAAIAARYGRDNILGGVSQAAGVPTGALIEYGSNANGEYWRFAGGLQICRAWRGVSNCTLGMTAGLFRTTTDASWTYPAAFAVAPTPSGVVVDAWPEAWFMAPDFGYNSTTFYGFNVASTASRPGTANVQLEAIGRWY